MKTLFALILICSTLILNAQQLTFTVLITDISTDTTVSFTMPNNIVWSAQVNSVSLTGVLDGTFILQQSNDGTNFNTLAGFTTLTLNAANASTSYEKASFSHKIFAFKITKVGLTGGSVVVVFNFKRV